MVLEKTLESPLDCKEIQPVHSEGDQPWDFFGGNDSEAIITSSITYLCLDSGLMTSDLEGTFKVS